MLERLTEFLDAACPAVTRHQYPIGKVVALHSPSLVTLALAERRLERTELLTLAFGRGILTTEPDKDCPVRAAVRSQFGATLVADFVKHLYRGFESRVPVWRESTSTVELCRETNRLTLEVVLKTFMGCSQDEVIDPIAAVITDALELLGPATRMALGENCQLPADFHGRLEQVSAGFDDILFPLIEARRREPEPSGDLLDTLLQAGFPSRTIRDELVSLLLAGSETSALTVSWAFVLLRDRPELEQQLRQEADAVLSHGVPTVSEVENLTWARAVALETLRLRPPVWQLVRKARTALEIKGERIERDSLVVLCPYSLHRRASDWEQPELFRPERFFDPAAVRVKSYLPFSTGHHVCLGRKAALCEVALMLALFSRQFQVELEGDEASPSLGATLRHRVPVRARLKAR